LHRGGRLANTFRDPAGYHEAIVRRLFGIANSSGYS
jgi:hypothetical protein